MERALRRLPLDRYRRIFVVGAGKASAAMARASERVLGKRVTAGLINTKDGHLAPLKRIALNECSHPVPDERGVEGARRISELLRGTESGDLVLCLISGGGSALLPAPAEGVTLEEKQETTRLLLSCGGDDSGDQRGTEAPLRDQGRADGASGRARRAWWRCCYRT